MRLRLAMTANRVHAHGGAPSPSAAVVSSDVNHMVWNSVLESMATGSEPIQRAVDPTPWPPQAQTLPPMYEPQPLYPTISLETGQRSLAELLAAAAAGSAVAEPATLVATPAAPVDAAPSIEVPADVIPAAGVPAAEVPTAAPSAIAPFVDEPSNGPLAEAAAAVSTVVVPSMIVPSMPVLGQPSRAAPSARAASSLLTQTDPVDAAGAIKHTSKQGKKSKAATVSRARSNQKRRPFRAFFAFIAVAGILGGAAYGGWFYFLKSKVSWAADVAPVAAQVEAVMHQQFTETVPVETLTVPEYEVKLGLAVMADAYASPTGDLTALRAVGLVGPTVDAMSIGRVVAAARPSFYDRTTSTILRVDGATPVFQHSLATSLAIALADQRLEWSKGFDALTDSQQVGVIASVDGIASSVAETILAATPADITVVASELAGRFRAVGLDGDQVPAIAALAVASSASGASPRSPDPADPLASFSIPSDDGVIFDPARDPSIRTVMAPATAPDGMPGRTLGMQFWYTTLATALGPDAARGVALAWAGDSSSVTVVNDGFACLNASIVTFDEAGQVALGGALMQVAESRPASSAATVSIQPGNLVTVSMCQSAEPQQTVMSSAAIGQLYTLASAEIEVANALSASGLPATSKAWGCAVIARRGGSLADYTVGTTDPAIIEQMTAVTQFCSAP